jgi:hypothetical protein
MEVVMTTVSRKWQFRPEFMMTRIRPYYPNDVHRIATEEKGAADLLGCGETN